MSHVAYMNPIWTACNKTKISELQRIQNKIVKNIQCKPRLTPTVELYTNIFDVKKFSMLQIVLTIHKIKLSKLKSDLVFNTTSQYSNYLLRNLWNLRAHLFKTEKSKKSLLSRGIAIYNQIPIEIRNISNVNIFKKQTKIYILTNNLCM